MIICVNVYNLINPPDQLGYNLGVCVRLKGVASLCEEHLNNEVKIRT